LRPCLPPRCSEIEHTIVSGWPNARLTNECETSSLTWRAHGPGWLWRRRSGDATTLREADWQRKRRPRTARRLFPLVLFRPHLTAEASGQGEACGPTGPSRVTWLLRSVARCQLPHRTALRSYGIPASQESPERHGLAVQPRGLCGGGQSLSRSWCRSPWPWQRPREPARQSSNARTRRTRPSSETWPCRPALWCRSPVDVRLDRSRGCAVLRGSRLGLARIAPADRPTTP
jgi:hypothetical protein